MLCPICKRPILESEPISEGGAFVYHRACWRPRGIAPELARPAP
jgi:hypothetical protein